MKTACLYDSGHMIVVDTSALMAIILQEAERAMFLTALAEADALSISAATVVETRMVCLCRGREILVTEADILMDAFGINIVAVDEEQAMLAHQAFVQYGKGQGHPAQLNFGDLFSYALAKAHDAPLLFKGDDFSQTDIVSALSA